MQLESVRALKQELPRHLERKFAIRGRGFVEASAAVAFAASRARTGPSYFLGVGSKAKRSYCLAVRLQDRALEQSALIDEIRAKAKGEVDVRYVGQIRARLTAAAAASPWYRSRQRPLLIGASVGFLATEFTMAGTLGCFVRKSGSAQYILSNNHVLADENRYKVGNAIVQPGPLDGGDAQTDSVGSLSAFVKLAPAGANLVDCAIAKVSAETVIDPSTLKGIGKLAGLIARDLEIGDIVHRVGRTTGVRHGKVTAIELDGVNVKYDIGILSFENQIEIEGGGARSFSEAGDSGSLIVDDALKAGGLLFSGGDHGGHNGKGLTYANPIKRVLSALKVKLVY